MKNSKPVTFRARGLSDARDGTNAFPGAMGTLQNLILDPGTEDVFVPRPAAIELVDLATEVTGAAQVNALLAVGSLYYGLVAATSGAYSGKDVPFAYNVSTQVFLPISIPGGAASLPDTPPTTGDWTPPTAAVIGGRVVFTHPGFPGGTGPYFGWLDISGFSSATITGDTHSDKTIDSLSADVITDGWQVGMTILDDAGDIPANTTITGIAADGMSLAISNAATGSHSAAVFTVSGGTSSAPVWGSGNTNGNALRAVPVCVSNFNARAWYGVPGSGLVFSDPGLPCQVTQATQALTAQNGLDITALGGLPVSQTQGGILAALIGFQGDAEMQMVTGDVLTSNLTLNSLGVGVGCLAPNTICQTPLGLTFVAPDGLRYVNFFGTVSDPVGTGGTGVLNPFLDAINPSRMAAAYNQDVFRVVAQNGGAIGQPLQDYWYHVSRKRWTGPHSFIYGLAASYQGSPSHGFVLTSTLQLGKLYSSEVTPVPTSSYTELGSVLACVWRTSLLPDNSSMAENRINESMLGAQLPSGAVLSVTVQDEASTQLDAVEIAGPTTSPTTWGAFEWGAAVWSGQQGYFVQYDLPWHTALVFKQATFSVAGNAVAGLAIGNLYFRYQALGYRTQVWPFVPTVIPTPPPPPPPTILTEGGITIETESGASLLTEG